MTCSGDNVRLNVLGCRADVLGSTFLWSFGKTLCRQGWSQSQTETMSEIGLIRTYKKMAEELVAEQAGPDQGDVLRGIQI